MVTGGAKMIIDTGNERIDICCYKMMQQLLYQGINPDWGYCPFCSQEIDYLEEDDTLIACIGAKDEMYPM